MSGPSVKKRVLLPGGIAKSNLWKTWVFEFLLVSCESVPPPVLNGWLPAGFLSDSP